MEFNFTFDNKNIIPAIISIILGISFWFYAKTEPEITKVRDYPIIVRTDENIVVKDISADSVKLEVKGKIRLQQILKKVKPAVIIKGNRPQILDFQLEKEDLIFPAWLNIRDFEILSPDSLTVEIDSLMQKNVKVVAGKDVKIRPEEITIKGPRSLIKDINYLSPDSIPHGRITTITLDNKLIQVIPSRIRIIH